MRKKTVRLNLVMFLNSNLRSMDERFVEDKRVNKTALQENTC